MPDSISDRAPAPAQATTPVGLNHLVLNVRDIEESHRFYTEIIGLRHVGSIRPRPDGRKMRFYSGDHDGKLSHHDLALVENPNLPPLPEDWAMFDTPCAINHVAIGLPSREAWLRQLEYMQSKGVVFRRRVNHGMTHSLYISDPNGYGVELLYELPREMWENDIDGALNYAESLPTEGAAALEDETKNIPSFGRTAPAE